MKYWILAIAFALMASTSQASTACFGGFAADDYDKFSRLTAIDPINEPNVWSAYSARSDVGGYLFTVTLLDEGAARVQITPDNQAPVVDVVTSISNLEISHRISPTVVAYITCETAE